MNIVTSNLEMAAYFKFMTFAHVNFRQINGECLLEYMDNIQYLDIKNINSILEDFKTKYKPLTGTWDFE